jgi:ribonucleoside-diphosphate reductase alpha chain
MIRREGDGHAIDWDYLGRTTRQAVRFLDNAIEVGRWPAPQIGAMAQGNRKIGLGVMGFAEMLIQLGVPYASERATALAEELMQVLAEQALAASEELARQRGVFPNWEKSVYARQDVRVRNATRTSIAPTGTISIIAGTSPSIEPLFALAYRRQHVLEGQSLVELNPLFVSYARDKGFYSEGLIRQLQTGRSLSQSTQVPESAKGLFQTALEIAPSDHLRIQAAFQRHVDNAVSKTVNLPESASPDDVAAVYRQAWECGLKGITIFRYGSKEEQVLRLGAEETPEDREHLVRCDPGECRL